MPFIMPSITASLLRRSVTAYPCSYCEWLVRTRRASCCRPANVFIIYEHRCVQAAIANNARVILHLLVMQRRIRMAHKLRLRLSAGGRSNAPPSFCLRTFSLVSNAFGENKTIQIMNVCLFITALRTRRLFGSTLPALLCTWPMARRAKAACVLLRHPLLPAP